MENMETHGPTKGEAKLLLVLYPNAVHGFHGGKNNLLTKKCFC